MREADVDGDGKISQHDFVSVLTLQYLVDQLSVDQRRLAWIIALLQGGEGLVRVRADVDGIQQISLAQISVDQLGLLLVQFWFSSSSCRRRRRRKDQPIRFCQRRHSFMRFSDQFSSSSAPLANSKPGRRRRKGQPTPQISLVVAHC